jgi:hypothetical protein
LPADVPPWIPRTNRFIFKILLIADVLTNAIISFC